MDSSQTSKAKLKYVESAWEYLINHGLTHSSVGGLCRNMGISPSSLYYWFDDKDDIYITAGKYGLNKVVTNLFDYTFNHTNDVRGYFDGFLDEVDKYKRELSLAIQITTSPVFGDGMREKSRSFRILYKKYAEKIVRIFGCTELQANVFIYSLIAIVMDYVIWDDKDLAQMLLENLYSRIIAALDV